MEGLILLAWWIATPLCGMLAASRIDLFRRIPIAMAWGVVRQMVERSVARYSGKVREAIVAGPSRSSS